MYGEDGVMVDLGNIGKIIAASDVMVLGFAHFAECLLVDARSDEAEVPLIQVVDAVGSAPERHRWLKRRKPSLGRPQAFSFFGWPHSPGFLVQSGVWQQIRDRVCADSAPEAGAACDLALRQIQNLHISATQALLKGEHCLNLWPRPEVPEVRA